jgi:general secretion pathway protein C
MQSSFWQTVAQRYPWLIELAPKAAAWVIGIAIAGQLATVGLTVSRALGDGAVQAPAAAVPGGLRQAMDVASVVNAHLFGFQPPSPPADQDARPSTLPLVLTGTIATEDPARGAAILGQNAGSTRLYLADQPLPGGARLRAVYGDHVILERNGLLETLYLPRKLLAGVTPGLLPQAPPVALVPGNFAESATDTTEARRTAVRLARAAINLEHPPVNQILRPLARVTNGQFRGVEIAPMGGSAVFERLGFQSGDVVVAVNGAPLENAQAGFAALKSLDQMPVAHLTLMRDGEPHEVVLQTAQLAVEAQQASAESGLPPDEN